MKNIEINEKFAEALNLMENADGSIFITGRAGTGKSTLLEYFKQTTGKRVVLLAPTGVAAVNISGQTIHSFFRFKPNVTAEAAKKSGTKFAKSGGEIYKSLDTIIIDEISMVRADLFDAVDQFLRSVRKKRKVPFGGVKMIFIGDLYQLPPVVTTAEKDVFAHHYESPYFFSAKVFPEIELHTIELETIYRQTDEKFIGVLNGIRTSRLTDDDIKIINSRHEPEFTPYDNDRYIYLTSVNAKAAEINNFKLAQLKGLARSFNAVVKGDFDKNAMPAEAELKLKIGAQVMLLNNDSLGRWFNGTIATVVDFDDESVFVELPDGSTEAVEPNKWDIFKYALDEETKEITANSAGSMTQFPLKLAWAITIHKSQGKTFDKVVLDLSRGMFATGQAYVALSRCRTLDGIVLTHPLKRHHVLTDAKIVDFHEQLKPRQTHLIPDGDPESSARPTRHCESEGRSNPPSTPDN